MNIYHCFHYHNYLYNKVTFVIFRIVTLCWMTRWIVLNRKLIHVGWFTIGSIGLAIMMVINILLLQRLLQADFANTTSSKNEIKSTQNGNQTDNNNSSSQTDLIKKD